MSQKYSTFFIFFLVFLSIFLVACDTHNLAGQATESPTIFPKEEQTIQNSFECIDQDETSNSIFKDQHHIDQDQSIFTKSITYLDNGNHLIYSSQEDSCINSTHLREYYCKKNKMNSKIIDCPGSNFCTQGKCTTSCPLTPLIPPDQEAPLTDLTGQSFEELARSVYCGVQNMGDSTEDVSRETREEELFQQRLSVFNKLLSERITQGDLPPSGNILYVDPKEHLSKVGQGIGIHSTGGYNGDPLSTGDDIEVSKQRLMYFLKYTSSHQSIVGSTSYYLADSTVIGNTPIRTAESGFGWTYGSNQTPTGFFKLIRPELAADGEYDPVRYNDRITSALVVLTNLDTAYSETEGRNNPSTRAIWIHGFGTNTVEEQEDDGSLGCIHLLAQDMINLVSTILNKHQEYYIFISGQNDFGDLPQHDKNILCKFYTYSYCTVSGPTQEPQSLATPTYPGYGGIGFLNFPELDSRKEQIIDIAFPLVRHFEGFDEGDDTPDGTVCHGYLCEANKPTIGYGHALLEGEGWMVEVGLTEGEAADLLKNDLKNIYYPQTISELEKRGVTTEDLEPYQIAAAVSFRYNFLTNIIENSDTTWPGVLQPFNQGTAETSWKAFHKAQTIENSETLCPLPGLMRRRFAEWQLFSTGDWVEQPAGWNDAHTYANNHRTDGCPDE